MTDFKKKAEDIVSQMTLEEKISQIYTDSPAIERLGIPAYNWWNEALHGVARSGTATVFPQAIAMAASFNPELVHKVGDVISTEARAKYNEYRKYGGTDIYEGLTMFSPNINIFRDPRWGRGHETYGEDPYLTGIMGSAFVKGLQGDGKYYKATATLKHYAVHSGPEILRHGFNAEVSEEDLYDTYLKAFEYIVKAAEPAMVMGAYNRANGELCCGSRLLIEEILRGKFGFKGLFVSDCGAIQDFEGGHKKTSSKYESAAVAINNGCDLDCGESYKTLKTAYDKGLVSEETITKAAEKVMELKIRLGMFADDCEYDDIPYDVVACDGHRQLNRIMAQKSVVLLKNDGILPLKNDGKTIAVIGPIADNTDVLVSNYNGTPDRYVTILRGIQDAYNGKVIYAQGSDISKYYLKNNERTYYGSTYAWFKEAEIAAKYSDVVVLCLGISPKMEGEEGEGGDRRSIELPETQKVLLRKILAMGKPVVCINTSGSCIALDEADKGCNAVIQCFYPGAEGGNAVADILFGKVSPSGRLPVTFYHDDSDLPPFEDYSMKNRTHRFFTGKPTYPFGYGLSYADIKEEWTDDSTVRVTNRGGMDTDYTVLKFKKTVPFDLCGIKNIRIKVGETVEVKF